MKSIEHYMTSSPRTINSDQSLKFALSTMREHNIRHLPVLEANHPIGMLSERDIRFLESFEKVDLSELKVKEACTDDPYTVELNTPVKNVAREMARRKISSAMIVENGKLKGIFTWIDALNVLANLPE